MKAASRSRPLVLVCSSLPARAARGLFPVESDPSHFEFSSFDSDKGTSINDVGKILIPSPVQNPPNLPH